MSHNGHLYHPKWKGWLMLGAGAVGLVNANVAATYCRTAAIVDLLFALWCLGWGCWWLYEGKKHG